jgi:hypothetical protein
LQAHGRTTEVPSKETAFNYDFHVQFPISCSTRTVLQLCFGLRLQVNRDLNQGPLGKSVLGI